MAVMPSVRKKPQKHGLTVGILVLSACTFCFHSISLRRLLRKMHSFGIASLLLSEQETLESSVEVAQSDDKQCKLAGVHQHFIENVANQASAESILAAKKLHKL